MLAVIVILLVFAVLYGMWYVTLAARKSIDDWRDEADDEGFWDDP